MLLFFLALLISLFVLHFPFNIQVTGLGVLDWILTPLNKFLVNTMRKFIWGFLEEKVKTWLAEQIAVASIQLPLVGWQ